MSSKRTFTVSLDGLILTQVDERSNVTGRSRSSEISYLLQASMDHPECEGFAEKRTEFPQTTSIYIPVDIFSVVETMAARNFRSIGKQINVMLTGEIDRRARVNAETVNLLTRPGDQQQPEAG